MHRANLSVVVALVLAATVLGVFYANQWHGPIGALERFLYAATRGDGNTMLKLVYPSDVAYRPERLVGYRQAVNYTIVESRQVSEDLVWIVTDISNPRFPAIVRVYYVMTKRPDGWKVDLRRTSEANSPRRFP
jgi:hypothetical protein